ncbi:MAG: response regulator [Lachnospiraceae bacterium]|nr:response regulator [Lachnospiraceae bacterium]
MDVLKIIFIVLSVAVLVCIIRATTFKRKNLGYIIGSSLILVCNILCIFLLGVKSAKEAANVLMPYYIVSAWAFFFILLTIILVDRFRNYTVLLIVSAVSCAYQTYLALIQFKGARVFSFAKRMHFRKAWWVVTDSKNTGLFLSYRSYRFATYICLLAGILILASCIKLSHRIFKAVYLSFAILLAIYSLTEYLAVKYTMPVWIPCIINDICIIITLYIAALFSRSRLKEWSLDSFANDMSDGLILYDRRDDLIHINDMIRNTLPAELVESFRDRAKLEEWVGETTMVQGSKYIKFGNYERDYYFKLNVRELGKKDARIGTLYILHDTTDSITKIIAMEKANEELERASRMKSDFLANMSHEIRTPMNAVIGMAEIAMRENDPARKTDCLLQIQSSGKNLLNIINDILDYSKIESGKMEIIEENYEPVVELADIANVLATRVGDKDLDIFVIIENPIPHILRADAMRIRQVLINLANNAVKFTHEGRVRIHVKSEPISEGVVNMIYHVIDSGIGIKKEDMDKLFVSFQQVDSRRNRAVEGTGLGLAISQKLVEAMGGKIGVTSEYGTGSDFWFEVPQKVVDDSSDITVRNAENKHAFIFGEEKIRSQVFVRETSRLGVESSIISSLEEYVPTGKEEFLFFEEENYSEKVRTFLENHKEIQGSMLVEFDSTTTTDLDNLHIMHKPETTINLVHVLNRRLDDIRTVDGEKVFKIDFTAPDANFLIVDDNAINLTIAGGLLAPLNARIDTAGGGDEAVEKILQNDYDIVFMDHMMPGTDGVDATRRVRATKGRQEKPVIIALSANAMEEARRLFAEAGMNDFVAKPIDVKTLITAVKKWLPPEKIVEGEAVEPVQADTAEEVKAKIDGLDTATALKALGSVALYDKIAEEYYSSGADKLADITDAFTKKDWKDYTIKVHALKSSSRQIGAMELGDMAEALEKAGKADDIDTILSDHERTMEVYRDLLEKLSAFYGSDEGPGAADKPLIDHETLMSLMDELENTCNDLDIDGMEGVGNWLKTYSYPDDIKAHIEPLLKAIRDIDTEECLRIANILRDQPSE